MAEFITPLAKMLAGDEYIRRSAKYYPVLEPFAPRGSISYFNNHKVDSAKSAYERLHRVEGFDPASARCDRTKPSLFRAEIYEENRAHKVPIITNHWYGRPNRVQIDFPEKKFNRTSILQGAYARGGISHMIIDEDDRRICGN